MREERIGAQVAALKALDERTEPMTDAEYLAAFNAAMKGRQPENNDG